MERYQHGKIYKIVCNITGKVYIGSTCKKLLSQRLAWHVQDFKKWRRDNLKYNNISSFEIIAGENYYIELLELVCCNSKDELLIRERFYIKNNDCINKCKNLISTNEDKIEWQKNYYKNNNDKKKEYQKEYYQKKNNEILEQYKKKIKCPNCDKEMTSGCLLRHLKNSCPNKN